MAARSWDKGYAGGHKGPHTTQHHPRPFRTEFPPEEYWWRIIHKRRAKRCRVRRGPIYRALGLGGSPAIEFATRIQKDETRFVSTIDNAQPLVLVLLY